MHNDLYSRKFFHFLAGSIIPLIYLYSGLSKTQGIMILFPFLFFGLFLEYYRLTHKKFGEFFNKHIKRLLKKGEETRINSSLTFVIGCFITVLYFDKITAITAMFILNISDPLACITGMKLGKIKIGQKTLEGSLSFFLSAFLIILIFFDIRTALLGALLCSLTELLIRPPLDDNLLLAPLSAIYICILREMGLQ